MGWSDRIEGSKKIPRSPIAEMRLCNCGPLNLIVSHSWEGRDSCGALRSDCGFMTVPIVVVYNCTRVWTNMQYHYKMKAEGKSSGSTYILRTDNHEWPFDGMNVGRVVASIIVELWTFISILQIVWVHMGWKFMLMDPQQVMSHWPITYTK